jgi:2-dehydropantoate 2-reductase
LHEVCAELAASASAPRLVLCLQNGIGNEEILRAHFPPESIVRGLVYHAVTREGPGRVFWFGRGSTVIGRPFVGTRGEPDAEAEALAALLTESGFDTRASRDIRREVWKKLAVNAAINPLGAITGLTNGALVRSPLLVSLMRAAVRETEEVARAEEGHLIDMTDRTLEIALVTGRNRNSMLLDLEAGRGTEIEFLNGAIVRFAEQRGLAVPVNRTLHALVRGKEEALRMKSAEGPESVPGVTR